MLLGVFLFYLFYHYWGQLGSDLCLCFISDFDWLLSDWSWVSVSVTWLVVSYSVQYEVSNSFTPWLPRLTKVFLYVFVPPLHYLCIILKNSLVDERCLKFLHGTSCSTSPFPYYFRSIPYSNCYPIIVFWLSMRKCFWWESRIIFYQKKGTIDWLGAHTGFICFIPNS